MVKLTAAKTVDNSNLSELGLLSNWSALTGPSTVADRSSIAVSSGVVDMTVSGSGLTLVAREPVAGTVKGIVVEVNGHGTYALSNMSLYFLTIQDTFKGNFESSLFSRNDQLNGSSGNDALYGYKGSDTLSGKQGNDQLTGASGDDNLSGAPATTSSRAAPTTTSSTAAPARTSSRAPAGGTASSSIPSSMASTMSTPSPTGQRAPTRSSSTIRSSPASAHRGISRRANSSSAPRPPPSR